MKRREEKEKGAKEPSVNMMRRRSLAAATVLTCSCSVIRAQSCLKVDLNDATFEAPRENTINPAEVVNFAFDGDIYTKWLDYSGGATSWVTVSLADSEAVTTYGIVSANDASERDPANWTFSGSADGGATWVELDTQTGIAFSAREQRLAFQVNPSEESYQQYRLDVTSVLGGQSVELMQMAELELWAGYECHDPCCGVDCGDHGTCEDGTCRFVFSSCIRQVACTEVLPFPLS